MKRIIFIALVLVLIVSALLPIGVSAHKYPDVSLFVIRATAAVGGSISPSGNLIVFGGEGVTYTITPDEGYRISCVWVDGRPYGTISHYTFRNIRADHTIDATFAVIQVPHGWLWRWFSWIFGR